MRKARLSRSGKNWRHTASQTAPASRESPKPWKKQPIITRTNRRHRDVFPISSSAVPCVQRSYQRIPAL